MWGLAVDCTRPSCVADAPLALGIATRIRSPGWDNEWYPDDSHSNTGQAGTQALRLRWLRFRRSGRGAFSRSIVASWPGRDRASGPLAVSTAGGGRHSLPCGFAGEGWGGGVFLSRRLCRQTAPQVPAASGPDRRSGRHPRPSAGTVPAAPQGSGPAGRPTAAAGER